MPAVAGLRELHPDCFIGWAIEPGWSELLQSGEDFDKNPYSERSAGKPLVDEKESLEQLVAMVGRLDRRRR